MLTAEAINCHCVGVLFNKVVLKAKSEIHQKPNSIRVVPLTSGRQSGEPDRAGQSPRREGFGSQPKGSGFIPKSPAGGKHNPYLLINVMYLEKISNFTLLVIK